MDAAQLPGAKLTGGETRLKIPEGFPQAIAGGQTVWLGDLGAVLNWDLDLWGLHQDQVRETREQAQHTMDRLDRLRHDLERVRKEITAAADTSDSLPAYKDKLTDAQIKDVISYIRTLQK